MSRPKAIAPLEIYKLLPQTNCMRCTLPSCLAFAAALLSGQKKLTDCPTLSDKSSKILDTMLPKQAAQEPRQEEYLQDLQKQFTTLDKEAIAKERGAVCKAGEIILVSLGKEFYVDGEGQMRSSCHIIPWIQVPILNYLCNPTHKQITKRWISFREIRGGAEWQGFFGGRCEILLKRLADTQPALLGDLIDLFCGREVDGFDADIALVLHPMPHIPICICYQKAEGDLVSELTLLFDECCAENLPAKSLYTLCAGLVKMFEKIAVLHS